MTDPKKLRRDTIVTHAGRDPQRYAGLVNTPVFRGSTVLFPNVAAYESRDPNDYKVMRYGIYGTPTTFALEATVAQLEGGHAAVALPSGLAAIVAAIAAFVKGGDHILVVDSVYGPTRNFCEKRLKPFGVAVEYYDPLIAGGIARLILPELPERLALANPAAPYNTRALIDACRPYEKIDTFPRVAQSSPAQVRETIAKWKDLFADPRFPLPETVIPSAAVKD